MVIKRYEGEAPPLITVLLSHDVHLVNFTKLGEIIAQMFLIRVFFDSTHKHFFNSGVSAWSARVLKSVYKQYAKRIISVIITHSQVSLDKLEFKLSLQTRER